MASIHPDGYRHLLDRLRAARQRAGLSQAAASAQLGVYRSFVHKIESGERRLDPAELVRLARVYGRRAVWFLPRE